MPEFANNISEPVEVVVFKVILPHLEKSIRLKPGRSFPSAPVQGAEIGLPKKPGLRKESDSIDLPSASVCAKSFQILSGDHFFGFSSQLGCLGELFRCPVLLDQLAQIIEPAPDVGNHGRPFNRILGLVEEELQFLISSSAVSAWEMREASRLRSKEKSASREVEGHLELFVQDRNVAAHGDIAGFIDPESQFDLTADGKVPSDVLRLDVEIAYTPISIGRFNLPFDYWNVDSDAIFSNFYLFNRPKDLKRFLFQRQSCSFSEKPFDLIVRESDAH
jgi:hypothetical protein